MIAQYEDKLLKKKNKISNIKEQLNIEIETKTEIIQELKEEVELLENEINKIKHQYK